MTDKELVTQKIEKYMDLLRIENAADRDREISNQKRELRVELEALGAKHKLAAIMVECIQGEGGVVPLDPGFAQEIAVFLREREIVHFQRFGEALELLRDDLDRRNIYAFNPARSN